MTTEIFSWLVGTAVTVGGTLGAAIKIIWARMVQQYETVRAELADCHERHEQTEKEYMDVVTRLNRLEGYYDGYRAAKDAAEHAAPPDKSGPS